MIYVCFIPFPIKISFEICSKQLLTMRNRFLILPKPEKLNFNEFLRFKVLKTDENHNFPKKCRKSILQHAILCKKCTENGYTIGFAPNPPKLHVVTSRLLWLITYVLRGPSADGIPFQVDLSTSRSKSKSTSRSTTMQPVYSYFVSLSEGGMCI